jgi:hypothetical protein
MSRAREERWPIYWVGQKSVKFFGSKRNQLPAPVCVRSARGKHAKRSQRRPLARTDFAIVDSLPISMQRFPYDCFAGRPGAHNGLHTETAPSRIVNARSPPLRDARQSP